MFEFTGGAILEYIIINGECLLIGGIAQLGEQQTEENYLNSEGPAFDPRFPQ